MRHVIASVAVKLTVYDFVLPDERHLQMVGTLDWDDLYRLYKDREFEGVAPRFLSRGDKRYAQQIRTLDQLVALAQENRTQLVVPRLQPTVKWNTIHQQSTGADYDALVGPWLKGDGFHDKTPFGYWPIPEAEHLGNYDARSQRQYWSEAATHFDQMDWLSRTSVDLSAAAPGGPTAPRHSNSRPMPPPFSHSIPLRWFRYLWKTTRSHSRIPITRT